MAKEWFPRAPSRKATLDIAAHHEIGLNASAALENGEGYWRENFSFEKEKPSQRKLTLDITGRRKST